jgi:Fur family peroxide stress response transcriptional regulator
MELSQKQFRKRNAILECLKNTHDHPSAETLFQMLQKEHPDISLATVYRNLTLFKTQGMIQSLGTVNGIERFDANVNPHVHFICSSCSSVQDLPELDPPESLCSAAAKATGGQVSGCQLIFTGTCQNCLPQE